MKRAIILQIVLCVSVAAAATDPNLVAWWKFDEGTGTIAYDSAGSNHGNIHGATWTTGQVDGALSFDGINDYVGLPSNNPIWLPQNDFTASAWVYFDEDSVSGEHEYILDLDFTWYGTHEGCTGVALCRSGNNSKVAFYIETTNTTDILTSDDVLVKNRWYHVVIVRQGTTQAIYLDGSLNSSRSCSGDPIKFSGSCNDDKVNIGRYSEQCWTNPPYYLDGIIDDVRIYNRALSAEEVQELYEGGLPELTALEITGLNEVAEEFTTSYKAIAHYDNGASQDVTALAEWRVETDAVAEIEAGRLTTKQALYPERDITIYARYTENETTVNAEKQVSVFAACPTGTALEFDGLNDYIDCGSGPSNYDNITISAWMRTYTEGILVSNRYSSYSYGTWYTLSSIDIELGDNSWGGYKHLNFNTPTIDGLWHHIVYTKDGINNAVYVDGFLDQSFTSNADISWNVPTFIGRRWTKNEYISWFNGTIDDVRIYNRALSEEEIGEIMFSKPTVGEPNLVAYWDFDDGTGQIATDITGHGNDGILGSNSEPDIADPCWVESDAPIGRCTAEQVMVRNILGAIKDKTAASQSIADAKAKERASLELIEELRRQINKRQYQNTHKAKTQIHIALVQEQIASMKIDTTIKRLEEALRLLGYEVNTNSTPPSH